MEDEIIYLESDEEITSVIDKIKNAKFGRIVLVVPKEATLLQSVVNLKLLAKEATILGKEISLVTADKIGRNLASQVGLTVYDSIRDRRPVFQPSAPPEKTEEIIEIDMTQDQASVADVKPKGVPVHHFQEESKSMQKRVEPQVVRAWPKQKTQKEFDWRKARIIFWPLLGIIVILVLIVAFLTLPKVNIKLKVRAENYQKDELVTQISSAIQEQNLEQKIFPGNLIDLEKVQEENFPTTGKKNLGGKATGTLTLYNYWDSTPQSLDKGAKFSSSDKTFMSTGSATIPGTSIRGGNIVPGTATIEIVAENPGEDYNVKAGRFTIIGLTSAQQEKIYGQSGKDLTGGFSKEVNVTSEQDYNQAKDKLTENLNEKLKNELKEKSGTMEILEKAEIFETTDISSSADVDAEANDFTMKIKQRLRVIIFDRDAFNQFVILILEKQIPYDKMISLGPSDSITPAKIEPKYDQDLLVLNLKVEAKISSRVDLEKVKKDLLGKSRSKAESYLNNLSGVAGAEISYVPSFWLKKIPNFSRSVKVELEYVEDAPEPTISPSPELSPNPSPTISLTGEVTL